MSKKPWVNEEMVAKMEERRKWKNINTEEGKRNYRKLNNELRRETEKARETWMREEFEEIERWKRMVDMILVYGKVKELSWERKGSLGTGEIEDKNGEKLREKEAILRRWEEYLSELYAEEKRPDMINIESECEVNIDDRGCEILKSEVEKALKELKNDRAVGRDDIPAEIWRAMGECGIVELTKLFNQIYETGIWPEDFLEMVMVPIEKKKGATKCSDFRTIGLISHAAKVLLRVLNRRLYARLDQDMGEEQFSFRKGRGTRDAIGVMRMIGERYAEKGREVCVCFVDMEKAFDRVDWVILLKELRNRGVDWKERRLLLNLYMRQKAVIRVKAGESKGVKLGRGVRQGCCLSPTLFNIYLESMIREFCDGRKGVRIGGKRIECIRFADDMALLAENQRDLGIMMRKVEIACEKYGMRVNIDKTRVMKMGRVQNDPLNIWIGGEKTKQMGVVVRK